MGRRNKVYHKDLHQQAYRASLLQMERWVSLPELDAYLEHCIQEVTDSGQLKEAVKKWQDEIEALIPPEARWSSEFEEISSQPDM